MRKMLSLLSAAALVAAACSKDPVSTEHGSGSAQLSVIQALGPSDVVNVLIDGGRYQPPLAGDQEITTGAHHIAVLSTGGSVLASADFTAAANSHHTALIAGSLSSSISMGVTADSAPVPLPDAAKIRVVHMAQGAPALDAYLFKTGVAPDSESKFVSPFNFGTGSDPEFPGYGVRSPGNYTVMVAAPGSTTPLAQTTVTLANTDVWSVVLTWSAPGTLSLKAIKEGPTQ